MQQFTVTIKPGSKFAPLIEAETNGNLIIHLNEIPKDGKSNRAMLDMIAAHMDVPSENMRIIRGTHSKIKVVRANS